MEQIQDLEVHEEAYTTYEPLDELCSRHHPDNPKDHDLGSLIESIQEFGFVRNVMINETDNLLLYGHGTTEALWQMLESGEYQVPKRIKVNEAGMWLVPTDRGIRLSKKRAKAYVIADNRHSELGGWNEPRLVDNLIAIAGKDGRGLRGTGFDGDELDTLIRMYRPELIETPEDPGAQLDKAQELQKKWQVERGQIWEIGRHRLMCGDSTNEEDVKKLLDGNEPYLMVTDPPYGVNYDPNWRNVAAAEGKLAYAASRVGKVANDDRADWSIVYSLFPCLVMYAWSPPGDHIIITGKAILDAGFEIRNQIIWAKSNFPISRGAYTYRHEPCWYAVRKGNKASWIGPNNECTLWQINLDKNVDGGHSTQKPLECMARPIRNHEGDVADPFLGSGTTMVAAEQLNRICYGMEIAEKYCSVVLERMSGMGLTPKLLSE